MSYNLTCNDVIGPDPDLWSDVQVFTSMKKINCIVGMVVMMVGVTYFL